MAIFVQDSMTDSMWKELRPDVNVHTGEVGATWTRHPAVNSGQSRWYIANNRAHCGVWGAVYASGVPSSADYTVSCTYRIYTTISSGGVGANLGICGRMDTTADTYYSLYYQAGELVLIKRVAGVTAPALDSWVSTLTGGGTDYTFTLEMIGDQIKGYVNDTERVSATDSDITAAGRAGLRSLVPNDAATGNHIDNFIATDTSTPPAQRAYALGLVGL